VQKSCRREKRRSKTLTSPAPHCRKKSGVSEKGMGAQGAKEKRGAKYGAPSKIFLKIPARQGVEVLGGKIGRLHGLPVFLARRPESRADRCQMPPVLKRVLADGLLAPRRGIGFVSLAVGACSVANAFGRVQCNGRLGKGEKGRIAGRSRRRYRQKQETQFFLHVKSLPRFHAPFDPSGAKSALTCHYILTGRQKKEKNNCAARRFRQPPDKAFYIDKPGFLSI
jgi:hypothetical protein